MAFSDEEIAYLRSQPVARLATVNEDGRPDVVPVAFELAGEPAAEQWYDANRTVHEP